MSQGQPPPEGGNLDIGDRITNEQRQECGSAPTTTQEGIRKSSHCHRPSLCWWSLGCPGTLRSPEALLHIPREGQSQSHLRPPLTSTGHARRRELHRRGQEVPTPVIIVQGEGGASGSSGCHSSRLGVQDQGAAPVGSWGETPSWLADGHRLAVSSHGLSSVHLQTESDPWGPFLFL